MTSAPLRFRCRPELQGPSLVVGWKSDAGRLGARVTEYLVRKLGGEGFCEIEPEEFYPLVGVTIGNGVVQFPEGRFYCCADTNLIVFEGDAPSFGCYWYLNLMLDACETCRVKELYTIGGMVFPGAHTFPRELLGIFNSTELREALSEHHLSHARDFVTPSGQRPTLNSFLLWVARRRNVPGVNLWVPIPFYLLGVEDPRAERRVLQFLNDRLDLGVDLSEVEEDARKQNQAIAEMRSRLPDIDDSIRRLEINQALSEDQSERLVEEIEKHLGQTRR